MKTSNRTTLPEGTNLTTVKVAQESVLNHLKATRVIEDFSINQYENQDIVVNIILIPTFWQRIKRWFQ